MARQPRAEASGGKSAAAIIAELDARGPVFYGAVKVDPGDDGALLFSNGSDCRHWISIPTDEIEGIEFLHHAVCADHSHPFVRIALKAPKQPQAAMFSALAALHATPSKGFPSALAFNGPMGAMAAAAPGLCWNAQSMRWEPC